ncbi:probable serine/threonine-protein kinase DDB_G0282963 [Drosophila navojoa]|uniref:probable serine/threonine-protein kinase DDB_G0282963 n=1 Tax=Drosophila navojoa TaxID=7232 RepID=UPI0011BF6350|nr:probable serine/threonine-protein kinase DDB_G0282963 [Drosophila navojoa]
MHPFTKDIQPVVINGRPQSKLEPPKSKSAAALVKRKNRNARRKSHYQHHHNSNNSSGNNSSGNIDDHDNSVGHHDDDLAKEPCQFVPVRRKPLGEYMNLEGPTLTATAPAAAAAAAAATTGATAITTATTTATPVAPSPAATSSSSLPSTAMQGMRMSYAAAVQTGLGVKVMISPRLKKFNNKPGSKGQKANNHNNNHHNNNSKIIADTKFRIFDEQPHKPHIVRVDPKVFRADVEAMKGAARLKTTKSKKASAAAAATATATTSTPRILTLKTSELPTKPKAKSEDAEIKELELQFKELACNTDDTAAIAEDVMQTARNLNSIQGSSSTASNDSQGAPINQHHNTINNNNNNVKSPTFVDSISYLSFHHERLQQIVKNQSICVICLQSPEPMKIPQFEDKHFKYLEEASLLAQNRTMLRLWLNSDQLIC